MQTFGIYIKLHIPMKEAVLNGYIYAGDHDYPLTISILNKLTLKEKEILVKWCGFLPEPMASAQRLQVLSPCDELIIAAIKAECNKSVQDQKR